MNELIQSQTFKPLHEMTFKELTAVIVDSEARHLRAAALALFYQRYCSREKLEARRMRRDVLRSDVQWHGGGRNREEWITEEWFD